MKSQRAEHFIQFWCDAESFHATTLTRLRTHSLHSSTCKRRTESANYAVSETPGPIDDSSKSETSLYIPIECKGTSIDNRLNGLSPVSPIDQDAERSSQCHVEASTNDIVDQPALNQPSTSCTGQPIKQSLNIPLTCDTVASQNSSQNKILYQEIHSTNVPSDTHGFANLQSEASVNSSSSDVADERGSNTQTSSQINTDVQISRDGAKASPSSSPFASQDQADNISQKLKKSK